MDLSDLLGPGDIIAALKSSSKRQLLQDLSEKAEAKTGIPARQIFDTLLQRERLGSTGVGNGIAIPHGKLPGLTKISAIFARLDKAIDYEALDDQPVDIIFLLLAPEGAGADHLKALARIARVMREPDMVSKLRHTSEANALYALLTDTPASNAA
ncbi:MAG: PTS IIA-like nitrogen regulatory protein PtsN [Rhizobiaceae bacterium]